MHEVNSGRITTKNSNRHHFCNIQTRLKPFSHLMYNTETPASGSTRTLELLLSRAHTRSQEE